MVNTILLNSDTLDWLKYNDIIGSVIIGFPDISEIGISEINKYNEFIDKLFKLIMSKLKNNSFLIVIYTDRYWEDNKCIQLINKSTFILTNASKYNMNLIFKKIIINNNTKYNKLKYLNYTNVLCFKKASCYFTLPRALETDILIPKTNDKLWIKGFYVNIIELLVEFLQINNVKHISDFFCGYGTVLAVAKKYNINSFGIELNETIYKEAIKTLKLN